LVFSIRSKFKRKERWVLAPARAATAAGPAAHADALLAVTRESGMDADEELKEGRMDERTEHHVVMSVVDMI